MEFILDLINKLFMLLFFMSGLNVVRNLYFFIQSYVTKSKYFLNSRQLWLLGISLGYILTSITNGLTL